MVYVNKLGNLVHTATHTYFGMANKNVGDAFLLSWKVCDGEMDGFTNFSDTATEAQRVKANETIRCVATNSALRAKKRQITPSQMADAAITAFLKCQIDLFNENVDGCLTCYATYEAVIRRFGPGFSIKMGFGMHVGWAIEGAIGSELKIDATYLSPHVEMSDRLEASSKIFLAKLNVSHWLHNLASPGLKKYTRPIAYIRAEGVTCPFTVWTYDVMYNKIGFGKPTSTINPKTKKQDLTDWTHPEYTEIQEGLHADFMETWLKAYSAFVEGDWPAARRTFDAGMRLKPEDGPTLYLLGFMDANNDTLPENWDGAHFLDGF
jgi:class 3 adenylate cyclase